jgi:hypothetical protein
LITSVFSTKRVSYAVKHYLGFCSGGVDGVKNVGGAIPPEKEKHAHFYKQ